MTDQKGTANQRLTQIKDFLTMNKTATTIPWDPDCTKFPTRKELPDIPGAPPEAAWVWGDNDYVRAESRLLKGKGAEVSSSVVSTYLLRHGSPLRRGRSRLARSSQ